MNKCWNFSASAINWQSKYTASIATPTKSTANSIEFATPTSSTPSKCCFCPSIEYQNRLFYRSNRRRICSMCSAHCALTDP